MAESEREYLVYLPFDSHSKPNKKLDRYTVITK
jgi:hypothetical protein